MTRIVPLGQMVMDLGLIAVTRNAMAQVHRSEACEALARHVVGDWGEIDPDAWKVNEQALEYGRAIVSCYLDRHDRRFLIVTDADRSSTTILLPDEY